MGGTLHDGVSGQHEILGEKLSKLEDQHQQYKDYVELR